MSSGRALTLDHRIGSQAPYPLRHASGHITENINNLILVLQSVNYRVLSEEQFHIY